ncbi:hypothetical protein KALB_7174 [Kutzneria albida DSM 43870]|uniref:EamA domain-containing protein n=1 Tax=Kutzneria albida DSM 43870 TaxID=1449976 RepID=W5WIU7_9PSEU|nr:hypothetical protein KALB_7174 [Kutzneria albida DSM 43870]
MSGRLATVTTQLSTPVGRRAGATALTVLSAVAFGASGPLARAAMDAGLSAPQVTTARILLAALILLAGYLPLRGLPRFRRDQWQVLLGYALLGVAGVQLLFFVAVSRIPVGVAMLLEFLAPVLVALWIRFVRRTRLPHLMWVGTAFAVLGLAMVAQVWEGLRLDGLGLLAGLGTAICTAAYYLLGEHAASKGDPLALTAAAMVIGGVVVSVVSPPWSIPLSTLSAPTKIGVPVWLLLVLLAGLATAFAYVTGILALRHLPSAVAAVLGLIEPVVAAAGAWLLLGQALTVPQVIGAAVLLAGAALVQFASGRRLEPEPLP